VGRRGLAVGLAAPCCVVANGKIFCAPANALCFAESSPPTAYKEITAFRGDGHVSKYGREGPLLVILGFGARFARSGTVKLESISFGVNARASILLAGGIAVTH